MTLCKYCKGSGWRVVERDGYSYVQRCSCASKPDKQSLRKQAGIPERYAGCRLTNYHPQNNTNQIVVVEQMANFCDLFPAADGGVLLMGNPGVGKTHLAVGVLEKLIREKGANGRFYDFRTLLADLRSRYGTGDWSAEERVLDPVVRSEFVVLDDLGTEKATDWTADILGYIINARYQKRLCTFVTTNYLDRGLIPDYEHSGQESLEDRIGVRLRSRLYEMCVTFFVQGPDYRTLPIERKKQRGRRA